MKEKEKCLEQQLAAIIKPYCAWKIRHTAEENAQAEIALRQFTAALLSPEVKRRAKRCKTIDHGYIPHLYLVIKAVDTGAFCGACNELEHVLHRSVAAPVLSLTAELLMSHLEGAYAPEKQNIKSEL